MTRHTQPQVRHTALVVGAYTLLYTLFFAPVLFSERLLAPGDGIIYFLPNFAAPRALWDAHTWGGFAAVGDAQLMLWYPPAILFSLLGAKAYEPFVVAAYVLASAGAYGYVYTRTRARLAAAVGGTTYGLCAFMVAHVGHAAVIHTAAWLPLVIWTLAELRRRQAGRRWFVGAALVVALSALAGHPQMFAYTLTLAGCFALVNGWRAECGRWRYYARAAAAVAIGVGLAAVQLWPTAELAAQSWRAALDFGEFVAYSLPLRQAPVLLFPYLYGGAPGTLYGLPYFGAWPSSADGWGAGELSGYAGLLPLVLACAGFITKRRTTEARFWLAVAAVAFLLALGDATPLARLVYQLPVLDKFRVPARHYLELTFAVCVLAGDGVGALQAQATRSKLLARVLLGATLALVVTLCGLWLFAGKVNALALAQLNRTVTLKPWANPALYVPLLLFVIIGAALVYWQHRPDARARAVLLLAALVLDLASFGWFYEWHYRAPYEAYLRMPAAAEPLRAELAATHQRLLPVRGGTGRVAELPPNLSKLWQLPSASGYGPFIPTRTSRLLTMPPHGSVDESWRDPANQALDLMGVRYVLLPAGDIEPTTTDEQGARWALSDFNVDLGQGCNPANPQTYEFDLPRPVHAASVALVGTLACSVQIPDGQEVLQLTLDGADGGDTTTLPLRAGQDFSEWAYDCADVRPTMRHARAQVFRSYPADRAGARCDAHTYVSQRLPLNLSTPHDPVRHVALRWTGPAGTFSLRKITFFDDAQTSYPVTPAAAVLGDMTRWRRAGEIDAAHAGYPPTVKAEDVGASVVYENLRARPRAWLVSEVARVSAEEAFNAARTSRLPDGRAFDPARLALVEEPPDFPQQQSDPQATAEVVRLTARELVVRVSSHAPAFLVTSDTYYPGWRAFIGDAPAPLYRADYALRGTPVPAGTHLVRFEFRPRTLYYGAALSALSLLLLAAYTLRPTPVNRQPQQTHDRKD
ncbi:MAG TPA: YfhO family protein [Pyrinomonadaceae bacterium]|jgi:hypothetical protein